MNCYLYDGPVMEFQKVIARNWKSYTYAASEQKARCNLAYQFKKANNRIPDSRITLPGKIEVVQ